MSKERDSDAHWLIEGNCRVKFNPHNVRLVDKDKMDLLGGSDRNPCYMGGVFIVKQGEINIGVGQNVVRVTCGNTKEGTVVGVEDLTKGELKHLLRYCSLTVSKDKKTLLEIVKLK